MIRTATVFAVLAAFCGSAFAQDDREETKKKLMEKVREKIRQEHRKILSRLADAIEEEFAKIKPKKDPVKDPEPEGSAFDKQLKDLDRKIRKMELEKEKLLNQKRKLQRFKEDEKLIEKLKKEEIDPQEAQEIFDDSLNAHNEKNFDESIPGFKKLFYSPKFNARFRATCAYNVACGYALDGDADRGLDWLEIAVQAGFDNFDHIRTDTDMDSLRKHKRFKRMMADK